MVFFICPFQSKLCFLFFILGEWRTVAVPRERVWCDDGQEEALWLAGPDFGAIRPHGQWLLCVRNRLPISEYYPPPAGGITAAAVKLYDAR